MWALLISLKFKISIQYPNGTVWVPEVTSVFVTGRDECSANSLKRMLLKSTMDFPFHGKAITDEFPALNLLTSKHLKEKHWPPTRILKRDYCGVDRDCKLYAQVDPINRRVVN